MTNVAANGPESEKCGICGRQVIRARDEELGRSTLVEEVAPGAGRLGLEMSLVGGGLPRAYKTGTRTRFKQHRCDDRAGTAPTSVPR